MAAAAGGIAALLLALLGGCGLSGGTSSSGAGSARGASGGSFAWGGDLVLGRAPRPVTAIRAFSRPARPADALPPGARLTGPAGLFPSGPVRAPGGRLLRDRLRLLVAAGGLRLYAVPTAGGWVCSVLLPARSSSCGESWTAGYSSETTGASVWGLVPSTVAAVEVVLAGDRRVGATLGENAFVLALTGPQGPHDFRKLLLRLRDGSTRTVALPAPG